MPFVGQSKASIDACQQDNIPNSFMSVQETTVGPLGQIRNRIDALIEKAVRVESLIGVSTDRLLGPAPTPVEAPTVPAADPCGQLEEIQHMLAVLNDTLSQAMHHGERLSTM